MRAQTRAAGSCDCYVVLRRVAWVRKSVTQLVPVPGTEHARKRLHVLVSWGAGNLGL